MGAYSGASATSGDIRADYMKLLIAQLQNQNPLEPLDNNEMASQLAQLSELEELENMGGTFREVLLATHRQQAAALIGREVTFLLPDGSATAGGEVEAAELDGDEVRLHVGDQVIGLNDVITIRN
jgi:flagellar basal-body rod modification protein FlgD